MQSTKQEQLIDKNTQADTSANLKISLFGTPSFLLNGRSLSETSSNKVDALFAYLVSHPYPHLRDALASLLFTTQSRSQANNNLRVLLSRLRRVCEDTILITRQTVRLNPAYDVWLDTAVFQQTITEQPECALKLYQGDFLETLQVQDAKGFSEWAALEREQYRLRALETLLPLIKKHEENDNLDKAIYFGQQLLAIEPHHEGWHRWLIALHCQAGQPAEAEAQLEACRQIIAQTFNRDLSPSTLSLLKK